MSNDTNQLFAAVLSALSDVALLDSHWQDLEKIRRQSLTTDRRQKIERSMDVFSEEINAAMQKRDKSDWTADREERAQLKDWN